MKTEEYVRWRLNLRKETKADQEKNPTIDGVPIMTAHPKFQEGWIAALEWVLRDE